MGAFSFHWNSPSACFSSSVDLEKKWSLELAVHKIIESDANYYVTHIFERKMFLGNVKPKNGILRLNQSTYSIISRLANFFIRQINERSLHLYQFQLLVWCRNGWFAQCVCECVSENNYRIGWALAACGPPRDRLYTHASDRYSCIPNEAKRKIQTFKKLEKNQIRTWKEFNKYFNKSKRLTSASIHKIMKERKPLTQIFVVSFSLCKRLAMSEILWSLKHNPVAASQQL